MLDNIMGYWCSECAVTAAIFYGSLRYGLLSSDPLYLSIQLFGISLASKPLTALAMAQAEKFGLKGSVTTM